MIDHGGAHLLRLTSSMFVAIIGSYHSCQRIEGIEPHMLALETRNKADQATEISSTVSLLTIPIPLVPFRQYRYRTVSF